MNKGILLVASALWAGVAFGAVKYKCDGEWVDYWPCDSKPVENEMAEGSLDKKNEEAPLVFVGDPSIRLALVAAELEAAQIAARDCDWELKVEKGAMKCLTMLTKVGKNTRHEQAGDELMRLVKDERFFEKNRDEINRLYNIQLDIYKVVQLFNSVYSKG
ncbi:hypothetical protein JD551_16595 [Aeromonas caviae]|uniref:hypothetical protein n=1 Tax=Aeromonas TaxID=642 RepID=UPI00191FDA7A|nr:MULTISPECIES: hypothetical protein [Aeromonas]MBL0508520.1 hypothetical protein [Aeromonas caviae]MBL0550616.1 hypothetical protein [Aeromonas caviae]UCM50141.1 hypothetical protein LEO79_04215 [Aeromonas caviae]